MKAVILPRRTRTNLVDSAILVKPESLSEVIAQFPKQGPIPILDGESGHDYFTLMRVQCPPELTTAEHPVYDPRNNSELVYNKTGPILFAKLAIQGQVQISRADIPERKWQAYPIPNPSDASGRNIAGYRLLASVHTPPFYLILGDDCRKQLEIWGITEFDGLTRRLLDIK